LVDKPVMAQTKLLLRTLACVTANKKEVIRLDTISCTDTASLTVRK